MQPDVISFSYILRDQQGEILDSSSADSPITFLTGAGTIIEGLETPLIKTPLNVRKEVIVKAARAYGERDERMIQTVERDALPVEEISVGDQFQAGEDHHAPIVRVVAIEGNKVTLDANHPLAGQDLFFEVEVLSRRPATESEISHGHVHGPGGHHHH
ncbi:MAG: peptidylprolyl isomerase [Opitutaceae bacterium]